MFRSIYSSDTRKLPGGGGGGFLRVMEEVSKW